MKTIAEIIHQINFPLTFDNDKENRIYFESLTGFWHKSEYDDQDNETYFENSEGFIRDTIE